MFWNHFETYLEANKTQLARQPLGVPMKYLNAMHGLYQLSTYSHIWEFLCTPISYCHYHWWYWWLQLLQNHIWSTRTQEKFHEKLAVLFLASALLSLSGKTLQYMLWLLHRWADNSFLKRCRFCRVILNHKKSTQNKIYVFFWILYRLVQLQIRPRNVLLHEVLTDLRPDVGVTMSLWSGRLVSPNPLILPLA
jgi:hypothetical protein